MIPIKLTLEGVHSYRQRQEIDFSRLTDAGIFGIFGRVGSGKSTILEAITYALYGRIERLTRNDALKYSMTNLRAKTLLIDFECRAGKDDNRYRFVVEGTRNGKKFETVEFDRKSYQWMVESGCWMPIMCENPAESVLKLSYDNFKRTVIIPQGRFQDFIELKATERSKMMMELFGLERFDLSKKTDQLVKLNEHHLSELNGRLSQLSNATPDKLAQAQLDLANTNLLIATKDAVICTKQAEDTALDAHWKKIQELAKAAKAFETLTAQKDAMDVLEQAVKHYELCARDFKPLFDKLLEQQKTKNNTEKLEADTRTKIAQNAAELTHCEAQLDALRGTYDARENAKKQAEALLVLAKLKDVDALINVKNQRIAEGEKVVAKLKEGINQLKEKCRNQEAEREQIQKNQFDLVLLTEVKVWFEKQKSLLETKDSIVKSSHEVMAQGEEFVAKKNALLTGYQHLDRAEGIPEIQEKLQQELDKIGLESVKTEGQLQKMLVRDQLRIYAENLQDGEPCPLCGAAHHPNLDTHANIKDDIKAVRLQQEVLKQQTEKIRKTSIDLGILQAKLSECNNQKVKIRANWEAHKLLISTHESSFIWSEFDKNLPQAIDDEFGKAERQKKEIDSIGTKIKEVQLKIVSNEADISKYEVQLDKFRQEVGKDQNEANMMRGQILGVDVSAFEHIEAKDLTIESIKLKKQVESAVERFEKEDKNRQTLVSNRDGLNGSLMAIQKNKEAAAEDLTKINDELNQKIRASSFGSETRIRQILGQNMDLENQKSILINYKTDFILAQKNYEHQRSQIGELTFDDVAHRTLKTEIQTLKVSVDELRKESGRLETVEKQLQMQLKNQAELLKEKHILELRQANLARMASLFRSAGFVNYVSEVYLQNLARQANERFHRMTSQQLQLEVGDGNNFVVRDLLNNGKTRALNTLSGGQRFQAALCLALALADNVHVQLQSRENFFFLDEGFGSLDKESLQTVFETLKSLRKENRIVGVISHVEDLQQEMDVYLKIENCEEKGSTVQCI